MRKQCSSCGGFCGNTCKRENVAQQKPVAWMCAPFGDTEYKFSADQECENCVPCYTTPPQRTWVGLTESEKISLRYAKDGMTLDYEDYAEAIEAKLRENNT